MSIGMAILVLIAESDDGVSNEDVAQRCGLASVMGLGGITKGLNATLREWGFEPDEVICRDGVGVNRMWSAGGMLPRALKYAAALGIVPADAVPPPTPMRVRPKWGDEVHPLVLAAQKASEPEDL